MRNFLPTHLPTRSTYSKALTVLRSSGLPPLVLLLLLVSCETNVEGPLGPPVMEPAKPNFELTFLDCPDDAPDCEEATEEQLEEIRQLVEMTIPAGNGYMCDVARNSLLNAIDNGAVDTYEDYLRYSGGRYVRVLGTYATGNGRFSFNRGYFSARCNQGWCTSDRFVETIAHEGGHAAIAAAGGDNTESQAEWFEQNCVEW